MMQMTRMTRMSRMTRITRGGFPWPWSLALTSGAGRQVHEAHAPDEATLQVMPLLSESVTAHVPLIPVSHGSYPSYPSQPRSRLSLLLPLSLSLSLALPPS